MGNHRVRDRAVSSAILIVDDDRSWAEDFRRFLQVDFDCIVAHTGPEAVRMAEERELAAALVDLDLDDPRMDGFAVVDALRKIDGRTAIVIITQDNTEETAARAREFEVQGYIRKSIGSEAVRISVLDSLKLQHVTERQRRAAEDRAAKEVQIVAESPAMKQMANEVERAARHRAPVLIRGPIGAGKMVVARRIHFLGAGARKPLEVVHCAMVPKGELVDQQLFGREIDAFTGAKSRIIGSFELAEDGTLLLDDIDYLPYEIQAKLLQPLEQPRTIRRLGGTTDIPVRCRVIATTNKDLDALVAKGEFRPDLLDRLRGAQEIVVPGIEERREDIPGLVRGFLGRAAASSGRSADTIEIGADFMAEVLRRRWRNVRELYNAVWFAVGVSEDGLLTPECLPVPGTAGGAAAPVAPSIAGTKRREGESLETYLDRMRESAVREALTANAWDKKAVAADLDITIQWLNELIRRQNIVP